MQLGTNPSNNPPSSGHSRSPHSALLEPTIEAVLTWLPKAYSENDYGRRVINIGKSNISFFIDVFDSKAPEIFRTLLDEVFLDIRKHNVSWAASGLYLDMVLNDRLPNREAEKLEQLKAYLNQLPAQTIVQGAELAALKLRGKVIEAAQNPFEYLKLNLIKK